MRNLFIVKDRDVFLDGKQIGHFCNSNVANDYANLMNFRNSPGLAVMVISSKGFTDEKDMRNIEARAVALDMQLRENGWLYQGTVMRADQNAAMGMYNYTPGPTDEPFVHVYAAD